MKLPSIYCAVLFIVTIPLDGITVGVGLTLSENAHEKIVNLQNDICEKLDKRIDCKPISELTIPFVVVENVNEKTLVLLQEVVKAFVQSQCITVDTAQPLISITNVVRIHINSNQLTDLQTLFIQTLQAKGFDKSKVAYHGRFSIFLFSVKSEEERILYGDLLLGEHNRDFNNLVKKIPFTPVALTLYDIQMNEDFITAYKLIDSFKLQCVQKSDVNYLMTDLHKLQMQLEGLSQSPLLKTK